MKNPMKNVLTSPAFYIIICAFVFSVSAAFKLDAWGATIVVKVWVPVMTWLIIASMAMFVDADTKATIATRNSKERRR